MNLNTIHKYLRKNAFIIFLCIVFIFILAKEFASFRERTLYVSVLFILVGIPIVFATFFRTIYVRKISVKAALFIYKIEMGLFVVAFILTYILGGLRLLGALLLGSLIFILLIIIYHYLKKRTSNPN